MRKVLFVNITSWTRVGSAGAEHFYAKIREFESDRHIFDLAREGWINADITEYKESELKKPLTSEEARYLNKKDGYGSIYRKGTMSDRFDTIDEIKAKVKELYPGLDAVFFNDKDLLSEENDVYEAQPQIDHKKTGKKIRIQNFEGFSKEFVNLTEGSIHEVIETPEKYKGKDLQPGVWVWGVTEPVLVLRREFEYV